MKKNIWTLQFGYLNDANQSAWLSLTNLTNPTAYKTYPQQLNLGKSNTFSVENGYPLSVSDICDF